MENDNRLILLSLIIISLASLLLISGCGKGDASDITDITGNAVDSVKDNALKELCINETEQCPACEEKECPEATTEECPRCDECVKCKTCPTCERCVKCKDFGQDPVDIGLLGAILYKKENLEGDKHNFAFKYSSAQLSSILSADLTLTPQCSANPKEIIVYLNGQKIYNQIPGCNQKLIVSLDKRYLKENNTLSIVSDVTARYRVFGINIETKYTNQTFSMNPLADFYFVTVADTQNVQLKSLGDVKIKNYADYTFDLSAEDIKYDLLLQFKGERTDDTLIVYANNNKITELVVNINSKEVVIPKNYLKRGANTIRLIGVS